MNGHFKVSDYEGDESVALSKRRYQQLCLQQHRLQMALKKAERAKKQAGIKVAMSVLNAAGIAEGDFLEAKAFEGEITIAVEKAFIHKGYVTNINGPVVANTTRRSRQKRFGIQRTHDWRYVGTPLIEAQS